MLEERLGSGSDNKIRNIGMNDCRIMRIIYLFIYLFLPPGLNPKSYGRARVLEAPSRPMLVIQRSFYEEMMV